MMKKPLFSIVCMHASKWSQLKKKKKIKKAYPLFRSDTTKESLKQRLAEKDLKLKHLQSTYKSSTNKLQQRALFWLKEKDVLWIV